VWRKAERLSRWTRLRHASGRGRGRGRRRASRRLAVVASTIFDATGVRVRRVPFRAPRRLAALKAAGV